MCCNTYYPIQFFRSPKEQSIVLLRSLLQGIPNTIDVEKEVNKLFLEKEKQDRSGDHKHE
jgi:hypothetical protein